MWRRAHYTGAARRKPSTSIPGFASTRSGGRHAEAGHIRTLQDCAQICATSADFMVRGSPLHARTCGVCAEVCDACADSCERLAQSDQQMRACVDACRRCAESCRRMAAMAV